MRRVLQIETDGEETSDVELEAVEENDSVEGMKDAMHWSLLGLAASLQASSTLKNAQVQELVDNADGFARGCYLSVLRAKVSRFLDSVDISDADKSDVNSMSAICEISFSDVRSEYCV